MSEHSRPTGLEEQVRCACGANIGEPCDSRVELYDEWPVVLKLLDEAGQLEPTGQVCDLDMGCGSGKDVHRAYDAQMIYLTRGCTTCLPDKLKSYRPEILHGYGQADVDEPIEPED